MSTRINGMSSIRMAVIALMTSIPGLDALQGEKWFEAEDAIVNLIKSMIDKEEL